MLAGSVLDGARSCSTPRIAHGFGMEHSVPQYHRIRASFAGKRSHSEHGKQSAAPKLSSHRSQISRHARLAIVTAALPMEIEEALVSISNSEYRDLACFTGATIGAYIWVKLFNKLAEKGILDQKLSRKLVHMTAGPLFVLSWPLFSADPEARFVAAVVPLLNFTRLFSVGTGILQDQKLVKSVSRSGDKEELLQGPLYYCIVLIAATVICWREHPAGLVAISMMCGGDGLADIVGRRLGTVKLPYNGNKSWAGSSAMMVGGVGMSYGLCTLFSSLGYFSCDPNTLLLYLTVICLAATIVESLPITEVVDDNLSVPAVAVALSFVLLS